MKYLDLTLPTPAENLACDEALLDWCEETDGNDVLRTWESRQYFVVVGYSNKVDIEVDRRACDKKQIPILRRCSGGGAVVQGPGCLNYSLILKFTENESLQTIPKANRFVMERQRNLLEQYLRRAVSVEGHTDLTVEGIKFSGNAQRRKKKYLLFHGTLLRQFNIPIITQLLKPPSKQPEYRENRSHEDFLTNLCRPELEMKDLLRKGWQASDQLESYPDLTLLLREKYTRDEWNFKF